MASNTTAQRSRSYRERIKSYPLKYAESLKKDRERYLKKKQQGVVKSVTEMPKREQRKMRRQWRISQRNRRRKWKMVSAVNSFMAHTTPPPSPDNMSVNAEDIPETPQLCEPTPERTPQRKRGRKKVAKAKAKVYRDLNDIKQKLEDALRKVEKYKKISNRLKKNLGILESPKMKTKQQMQQESKQLKKTLLFHNGVVSVCTISSSMRHDPSEIWAHLKKVLPYLKQQNTAATTLHVISDGPTTQYRSKNNFFFLSKVPYELGFKKVTWNFLEAGHGKGPADGIGAAVKRQADSLVAKGIDLPTGKVLYEQLLNQPSTVKLMYITEGEIEEMDSLLPDDLLTIKGTMQIHQIVSTRLEEISWRVLSCFCADPHPCQCFGLKKVNILGAQNMETALGSPSSSTLTSTSQPIIDLHEGLIGSWCVVRYDGDPYPGIIQDVDPEGCALVRTMSHIGKNKFFWPMRDDVIWYRPEDVIRLVPEPQPVTKRHVMVEPTVWKEICSVLDHET
ncbi:uncharacterized protein LOC123481960 [Coregonus clupeaformis]|uniref:uncharacterized protein LOC123481960 n=1 Tax=Coregonus clupeaformis TaxID=59861 RepID=UPI001E1C5198|nr:uncharacterized protein LOC123481960 [Coregonus clupeaformis]